MYMSQVGGTQTAYRYEPLLWPKVPHKPIVSDWEIIATPQEGGNTIQKAWQQCRVLKTVISGGKFFLSFEDLMAESIGRIFPRAEAGRISVRGEVLNQ